MTVTVVRGNALELPLADGSVDLVVTSPPYFGLRSYQDGCSTCDGSPDSYRVKTCSGCGETTSRVKCHNGCGVPMRWVKPEAAQQTDTCPDCHGTGKGHYGGQLGSEATPTEFVDALLAATAEMVRVVKGSGSLWLNLGDGYCDKSLRLLPHRYAIRCIDELGLILRAEVIWSKPNGLPESVTDRVRRSHEQWFHFVKEPRYFSAVDEIREAHAPTSMARYASGFGQTTYSAELGKRYKAEQVAPNPLGKLPGSVWTVPTQPLTVPASLGVDHFAAFPMEWPRRLIAAWSPGGVCVGCGEGRRPVVERGTARPARGRLLGTGSVGDLADPYLDGRAGAVHGANKNMVRTSEGWSFLVRDPSIVGSSCACGEERGTPAAVGVAGSDAYGSSRPASGALPPTVPAVVLDPFGGTGTTALVAHVMGRHGITVDLSADYCRLAAWRTSDPGQLAAAAQVDKPVPQVVGQETLFEGFPA